jgi:hypothetical protein
MRRCFLPFNSHYLRIDSERDLLWDTAMKMVKPIPGDAVRVTMGGPVVVSMADPAERNWGYYQFPTISRMPGGELLYTFNNTQDDNLCYGHAAPAYWSFDNGLSWQIVDLDEKGLTISHSPVAEVFDGEFLCAPMPIGYSPSELPPDALEQPVSRSKDYVARSFHSLERFPEKVKDYYGRWRALRWTPSTREWSDETIAWDVRQALVRIDESGVIGQCWSRPSLEYRPVRLGNELLDANYIMAYVHDDGAPPKGFEVWCMVSSDNGRSWKRRGLIAGDPDGTTPTTETGMCLTAKGDLVCVTRTTHRLQLPMWLTFSSDCGRSWSEPLALFDHGVLPQLQLLRNGVMALSFGRPGVHLSFSPKGDGRSWTDPIEVLPPGIPKESKWTWEEAFRADGDHIDLQKDGYTSIVPLRDDTFLLAYCDMAHVDSKGRKRRAAKVRTVTVNRR